MPDLSERLYAIHELFGSPVPTNGRKTFCAAKLLQYLEMVTCLRILTVVLFSLGRTWIGNKEREHATQPRDATCKNV